MGLLLDSDCSYEIRHVWTVYGTIIQLVLSHFLELHGFVGCRHSVGMAASSVVVPAEPKTISWRRTVECSNQQPCELKREQMHVIRVVGANEHGPYSDDCPHIILLLEVSLALYSVRSDIRLMCTEWRTEGIEAIRSKPTFASSRGSGPSSGLYNSTRPCCGHIGVYVVTSPFFVF